MKTWKTFSRSSKIAISVILLLIAIRLVLPYFVEKYVNKTLNDLPGYHGHVDDVDLHLYRGAYEIEGLFLNEDGQDPENPFLQIKETDLSIEWKSLFKGKLVGEVLLVQPRVYFIERKSKSAEEPSREHWSEVVKDLMPITINRLDVTEGRIDYLDYTASPDVNFYVEGMQLTAFNLANVDESGDALPSTVNLTGTSIGGGALNADMQVNVLKELPDFDMNIELTNADLTSLNSFIKAYGKFDVERGQLDAYSELKLMNGEMSGYVKPFFENVKVLNWKKDKEEGGVLSAVKEAVIGVFTEAAENQKRDQVATVVPIEGNVNQPDADISRTIINTLKHAFINAFNKGLEQNLSAAVGGSGNGENKKDED